MNDKLRNLGDAATVVMGLSPKGDSYNHDGGGIPLLNGPTEFGASHPNCTLFTIDSKRECERGDLIFCVRGNTTGRMNWADQKYSLGRGVCGIRGETLGDTKYIRYCIEESLPKLLQMAGGSTMPTLTQSTIKQFPIPYPPHRDKIASILSAYDDLIENNLRRIRILEEMAQNLYREWFVKFRFPGHENARFVDGIPEGWRVGALGDVSRITAGFAFKSKDWTEVGIPVVKIKNIKPGNLVDIDQVDHVPEKTLSSKHSKFRLKHGDILVAMTGATAGKVGRIRSRRAMLLNQRVAKIDPEIGFGEFVWSMVSGSDAEKRFYALADGAAQPNMSGKQIENLEFVIPATEELRQFSLLTSPIFCLVDNMILQNDSLRHTRDLLLPRLISGELDVSELDITIPEETT